LASGKAFGRPSDGFYGCELQDNHLHHDMGCRWLGDHRSLLRGLGVVEGSHHSFLSLPLPFLHTFLFLFTRIHIIIQFWYPFLISMGKQHGAAPCVMVIASSFGAYGLSERYLLYYFLCLTHAPVTISVR
jgi:hypothetical protein